MQLAGCKCTFCSRPVVFAADGTACASCRTPSHRSCRAAAATCPRCGALWVDADSTPAFASRCPVCGTRNRIPPDSLCPACGSLLRYDSDAELDRERKRIHGFAIRRLAACVLLAGLGTALAAFTAWVFFGRAMYPWFQIIIGLPYGAAAGLAWARAARAGREALVCLAFR